MEQYVFIASSLVLLFHSNSLSNVVNYRMLLCNVIYAKHTLNNQFCFNDTTEFHNSGPTLLFNSDLANYRCQQDCPYTLKSASLSSIKKGIKNLHFKNTNEGQFCCTEAVFNCRSPWFT